MHVPQLLCDRMLRAILLLRQPLDPPDLRKELANLLHYVLAILLGHEILASDSARPNQPLFSNFRWFASWSNIAIFSTVSRI